MCGFYQSQEFRIVDVIEDMAELLSYFIQQVLILVFPYLSNLGTIVGTVAQLNVPDAQFDDKIPQENWFRASPIASRQNSRDRLERRPCQEGRTPPSQNHAHP